MSSILATKGCLSTSPHSLCSLKINYLGRYLGQYADNSPAKLVVEVYIKYYYGQGSVYDTILLFKIFTHSL